MTVYDLGERKGKWKVGMQLHFSPNYMAVARLMNNRYVTKRLVQRTPGSREEAQAGEDPRHSATG
jgi:hypothetical protein